MRLSFTLAESDFVDLQRVIGRRLTQISGANTKLFVSNLFVWLPLGVSFAAYFSLFRSYPELSTELAFAAVAFGIGVILMVVGAQYKQRLWRKAVLAPDSWFLSEQTVEMDSNGVILRGGYGESNYPWSTIRYHTEDERNLYLFIDNGQAFVLPKTAIGSSSELAQVKAWLSS
jgi:hypothetical protein